GVRFARGLRSSEIGRDSQHQCEEKRLSHDPSSRGRVGVSILAFGFRPVYNQLRIKIADRRRGLVEASEFASAAMASFIDPARIDAARCRACASRSFVTLLNHQEVKSGVRIAVTITEAATCTVAAPATEAYDVSARATACGTAAEL